MTTKKQNRQIWKRKVRRVLKIVPDFFKQASGSRLNKNGYGRALSRSDVRQHPEAD